MSTPSSAARRPVNRADVARLAGVSLAVVSYVTNGTRPVAAETRERVEAAIEALGYRPNAIARALRLGSSRTLGLLIPDSSNPLFAELSREIERAARRQGLAVLLTNSYGEAALEREQLRNLVDRQVDGLIVISATPEPDLRGTSDLGVPLVLLDRVTAMQGVTTVGVAFEDGARAAVEHLALEHGKTRIAAILGSDGAPPALARERGWARALRDLGLPEGRTAREEFTRDGGYRAGLALLTDERPDAIFASSDLQAVGLLRAAHERGVVVPDDVAVVAFDGSQESRFTWPALSVVRQPMHEIAEAAIAALLDGDNRGALHVVPTDLIVRESCGCTSLDS